MSAGKWPGRPGIIEKNTDFKAKTVPRKIRKRIVGNSVKTSAADEGSEEGAVFNGQK